MTRISEIVYGRRKILQGRTTFRWVYMQKSLSALCPSGEEIKDGGRLAGESEKNTIWALLLSLLKLITNSWQNYYNNQFLVTPNEMASLLLP